MPFFMLGIAPIKERMEAVNKVLNLPEHQHAFTHFPYWISTESKCTTK